MKIQKVSRAFSALILFTVIALSFATYVKNYSIINIDKAMASSNPLSGWAWSPNIGWVNFDSYSDISTGANNTAILSGYAWSPNIGWISFASSDLTGCPSGICQAQIDLTTGAVSGWAIALSGKGRTDGFDGWIELSGTNHISDPLSPTNSGVYLKTSDCTLSGMAWGSEVIGWLNFDKVQIPTSFCSFDFSIQPKGPFTIAPGQTIELPIELTKSQGADKDTTVSLSMIDPKLSGIQIPDSTNDLKKDAICKTFPCTKNVIISATQSAQTGTMTVRSSGVGAGVTRTQDYTINVSLSGPGEGENNNNNGNQNPGLGSASIDLGLQNSSGAVITKGHTANVRSGSGNVTLFWESTNSAQIIANSCRGTYNSSTGNQDNSWISTKGLSGVQTLTLPNGKYNIKIGCRSTDVSNSSVSDYIEITVSTPRAGEI